MIDFLERWKSCSSSGSDKIKSNVIKQAGTNVNNYDSLSEVTGDDDHAAWDRTWLSPAPPPLRENTGIMS